MTSSANTKAPSFMPTYTKVWHTKVHPTISPTRPENSAKNKVVVITGGGIGTGAAIAKAFAEAGAKAVGLIGRRENHLKTSAETLSSISTSIKIEYAVADITDKSALESAFEKFEGSLGKIDVLVSNAGYLSDIVPLQKADDEDWWRGFEINVKGTFNVIKSFLFHAGSNAVFLGVNAGLATSSEPPGLSSYISSKIACARMLECMQAEHPEIRVISVHPGVVDTAMTEKTKVPPMDDASLVAGLMVWLAGPEANFMKGRFMWANFDIDELKERAAEIEKGNELRLGLLGLTPPEMFFKK
ncbi:NAD(P)-binding protein [Mollisia scopiformis]|uniref:NAD(P)-binding protein n=1 Tax=Mollisia scopiformis TaxID=149040 RepID=A0A194WW09_MOLSC|nr:NAD(P)-binding protein [Mollisia scopiformis]KUJ11859.1 NAD(P)-binding protein [Mollisia scopiformis]